MAPALTQASDPHTFPVAPHHPSSRQAAPPPQHTALQYGGLKEPHACTDAHLAAALANGSPRSPCRLQPPVPGVGGAACGRPQPAPRSALSNMDPALTTTTEAHRPESKTAAMGQDTSPPDPQAPAPHKSPRPTAQDGDLLALIGRDFANMNDIIDTLTRLADNPEVLAAVDTASLVLPSEPPRTPPPVSEESSQQVSREERARVLLEELSRRQWLIERRQARLERRLRRVTARGLSATVSGQLRELLEHGHAALANQRQQTPTPHDPLAGLQPTELGLESLRAEAMRGMSTTALVQLVRRVEASQSLARLTTVPARPPRPQPSSPAPVLPEHTRAEVTTVVSELQAAVHAHTHHDSDATETSSGGESCDELDGYSTTASNYAPVRDRAFFKYCRARAWVASRWTWLQAQIADLEYRILQQHKIYAHVRNSKGAVQVEEGCKWRGVAGRDPAHLDLHNPALTCLTTPTRTTLNGYHGRVEDGLAGSGADPSSVAVRTQGLKSIKRRRLVRAGAGLCAGLRRGGGGGRIPAVQCKCVPPQTCVLCTRLQGTVPPATPPDPYTQPVNERQARVDPTYHPVLSQSTDVSLSERFDAMLKTTDWQRQIVTAKTVQPAPITTNSREVTQVEKKRKRDKDRRKELRKQKKEGKNRIMLKLKKSLFTGELIKDGESKRKKLPSQEPVLPLKKVRVEEDDDASSVYGSSLHSSPSASPAPVDRSALRRHCGSSNPKNKQSTSAISYDIDNIVIPYSMAASTRVEKLEYKEIPTPKWRIVPLFPNNVHSATSQDDDEEDVSEEATAARHSRSEELERKKFLQYLHMQVTSRSSRSRRTDSSGTNTPDHPLSPRPPDPASDTVSPLATPPTTPLAPSEDSNQSSSLSVLVSVPHTSTTSTAPTSSFPSLSSQPSLMNTSLQNNTSSSQANQLLIHNSQLSSSSLLSQFPTSSSSALSSASTLLSGAPNPTPTLSSLLPASRRSRTFSSSSSSNTTSKIRALLMADEGARTERLEGVIPYEQRTFPLNDATYQMMTKETEDCDNVNLGSSSSSFNLATDTNNLEESGRSSPLSEVTDSAPEEDEGFDDSAAPKWTISGLKDATGQYVLQIHRN